MKGNWSKQTEKSLELLSENLQLKVLNAVSGFTPVGENLKAKIKEVITPGLLEAAKLGFNDSSEYVHDGLTFSPPFSSTTTYKIVKNGKEITDPDEVEAVASTVKDAMDNMTVSMNKTFDEMNKTFDILNKELR